jgi:plasmid stabilization system protein ParE
MRSRGVRPNLNISAKLKQGLGVHINEQGQGLGVAFAQEIEAATARALAFPGAGSPATKNTKRVLLKKFPFSVVFRPDREGIVVFAVAHHSRRPDYWVPRL